MKQSKSTLTLRAGRMKEVNVIRWVWTVRDYSLEKRGWELAMFFHMDKKLKSGRMNFTYRAVSVYLQKIPPLSTISTNCLKKKIEPLVKCESEDGIFQLLSRWKIQNQCTLSVVSKRTLFCHTIADGFFWIQWLFNFKIGSCRQDKYCRRTNILRCVKIRL